MSNDSEAFRKTIADVDRRVRELAGAGEEIVLRTDAPDTATWDRGDYRGTLSLHTAEKLPRLSLSLHTGTQMHPDPVQIGLYDADVVELIAEPIAGLLSGRVTL
ncbi:MAG: hypothetical protein JO060_01805 [Candidatus Eremiobacteraeota bacterium]|nr:hypothetical protein [Candidatus Eremiobacteraeota bacterium]